MSQEVFGWKGRRLGELFWLRSSPEFNLLWQSFLQDSLLQVNASSIFYQHVTDNFFYKLVEQEFQLTDTKMHSL